YDPVTDTTLTLGWAPISAHGVPFAYDASGDIVVDPQTGLAAPAESAFYGFTLVAPSPVSEVTIGLKNAEVPATGADPAKTLDPTIVGTVVDDVDGTSNVIVDFYLDGPQSEYLGSTYVNHDGSFSFAPAGLEFSLTNISAESTAPIAIVARTR